MPSPDSLVILVFLIGLMVMGSYLLMSRNYIKDSTARQRKMGREFLARYQETGCYFFFVKAMGIALIMGPGCMILIFIRNLIRGYI